jgi:hypothetical protein
MKRVKNSNPAATAWYILGGLMALGLTILVVREFPAMRRELRMMRM